MRHEKLRTCTWLNNKHELIKVIDQPWVPLHETTKYLSEAEVLPDFLPHLTGGIEELKTSTYECNLLTFINEVQQFHELDTASGPYSDPNQGPGPGPGPGLGRNPGSDPGPGSRMVVST